MKSPADPTFFKGRIGMTRREWCVVVALVIIALLVALPYFQQYRARSHAAVSQANLQQWGIALNLFLIENKSQLPVVGSGKSETDRLDAYAWYEALPPYLSQPSLSSLPPHRRPVPGDESLWIDPAAQEKKLASGEEFHFHYGMNRFLQPDSGALSLKIYEVENPGSVVFLTEVNGGDPGAVPSTVDSRHGGGKRMVHVLFCDGFVTAVPASELRLNPVDSRARIRWRPHHGAADPAMNKEPR
jgi:prepilin-type processing-associated H-X9-DG protein